MANNYGMGALDDNWGDYYKEQRGANQFFHNSIINQSISEIIKALHNETKNQHRIIDISFLTYMVNGDWNITVHVIWNYKKDDYVKFVALDGITIGDYVSSIVGLVPELSNKITPYDVIDELLLQDYFETDFVAMYPSKRESTVNQFGVLSQGKLMTSVLVSQTGVNVDMRTEQLRNKNGKWVISTINQVIDKLGGV